MHCPGVESRSIDVKLLAFSHEAIALTPIGTLVLLPEANSRENQTDKFLPLSFKRQMLLEPLSALFNGNRAIPGRRFGNIPKSLAGIFQHRVGDMLAVSALRNASDAAMMVSANSALAPSPKACVMETRLTPCFWRRRLESTYSAVSRKNRDWLWTRTMSMWGGIDSCSF
jgi:hypothetical protein